MTLSCYIEIILDTKSPFYHTTVYFSRYSYVQQHVVDRNVGCRCPVLFYNCKSTISIACIHVIYFMLHSCSLMGITVPNVNQAEVQEKNAVTVIQNVIMYYAKFYQINGPANL